MSHVIIKIPKEEQKRIFCGKIHKIFLLKKLFTWIKRERKLFEAAEWLKKNCVVAYQNGTHSPPPPPPSVEKNNGPP